VRSVRRREDLWRLRRARRLTGVLPPPQVEAPRRTVVAVDGEGQRPVGARGEAQTARGQPGLEVVVGKGAVAVGRRPVEQRVEVAATRVDESFTAERRRPGEPDRCSAGVAGVVAFARLRRRADRRLDERPAPCCRECGRIRLVVVRRRRSVRTRRACHQDDESRRNQDSHAGQSRPHGLARWRCHVHRPPASNISRGRYCRPRSGPAPISMTPEPTRSRTPKTVRGGSVI
jgi:hypothetical protein